MINDFDKLCAETLKLVGGGAKELSIGSLRHSRGRELKLALAEFAEKFPDVELNLLTGTHEELYEFLRSGKADVVISDLRRKPSEQYVNFFLAKGYFYVELPEKNSLARLESLTVEDLKNTPIILIAPQGQRLIEENFFREYFGVKSEFIFAETLEEAHLLVAANKGFFPIEFTSAPQNSDGVKYIPLVREGKQLYRKYFAFWRADTLKKYLEDFAEILRRYFPTE